MREPGEKIGYYVIRSLLGRGGMGEVYEAEDLRLGRRVALKLIPCGAEPDASERMLREARAAAGFEHRNVVVVFDVGVIDEGPCKGETYLAMELVRGRTMRALLRDDGVPLSRKLRWLIDVARALAAGHSAGLVHRDIKPDNLMVREDGVIKVLDFGIAKKSRSVDPSAPTEITPDVPTLTKAGSIVGTPRYASPEQLRGERLDGRADQYSWGATAFELLSGHAPFEADDPVTLLSRVLSGDPPKLGSLTRDIPWEVEATVMRAISRRAEDRFATLDDAADALEPFADAAFASADKATGRIAALSSPPKTERSAPSVVSRAARTSARIFFWIAAALGTVIIVAIVVGALTGHFRFTPPTTPSASTSGQATGTSNFAPALRCSDAQVTGEGASPELAHMLGIGACARLAVVTGRSWNHAAAFDKGSSSDNGLPLDVTVALGPTTRVSLRLGTLAESSSSTSPVEAMQAAVRAMATRIGTPPMSDAERADWGSSSPEGARRIERVWRALLIGDLADPESDARALVKTDPDSPWSHAILGIIELRGSKPSLDALTEAEARLDRLSGARKKGLGAIVRLLSKPKPDEAMRELRQAYDDAPDDADIAGLYAAIAVNLVPSDEGFAVVDRLAERFPTRAILALENAVIAPPRRDLDRDQRYISRLTQILPDASCFDLVVELRLERNDVPGAREIIARCKLYSGSASNDLGLDLREARVDLFAGDADQGHALAAKRLGDPRATVRAEAANLVIASQLVSGKVGDADETILAEWRRGRDEQSSLLAFRHAQALLRLHRRLGTEPPDEVVHWLEESLPKMTFLPEHTKLALAVDVALAKPTDVAKADALLAAIDKLGDPGTSLVSLPLVRQRHGDRAAVDLLRRSTRVGDGPRTLVAVDAALALIATKADVEEIDRSLALLRRPDAISEIALDTDIADLLLARALESAGKPDEAAKWMAKIDAAFVHADPGLKATLAKLK